VRVLFRSSFSLLILAISTSACASKSAKVDRSALRPELIERLSSSGGARDAAEAECLANAANGLGDGDFVLMAKGRTVSTKGSKRYAAAAALCSAPE
jgi:hypothetical protein